MREKVDTRNVHIGSASEFSYKLSSEIVIEPSASVMFALMPVSRAACLSLFRFGGSSQSEVQCSPFMPQLKYLDLFFKSLKYARLCCSLREGLDRASIHEIVPLGTTALSISSSKLP